MLVGRTLGTRQRQPLIGKSRAAGDATLTTQQVAGFSVARLHGIDVHDLEQGSALRLLQMRPVGHHPVAQRERRCGMHGVGPAMTRRQASPTGGEDASIQQTDGCVAGGLERAAALCPQRTPSSGRAGAMARCGLCCENARLQSDDEPMHPVPLNELKALHADSRAALRAAFDEVLDSGWYILGPRVRQFEEAFAAFCGTGFCVGVANGSDALELALRAVGVGRDDRVVTVANAGFYASAAILNCGATPLYVDIDPDSLLIDAAAVDALLEQVPRAVVVTHLYGRMAPVEAIVARCRAAGVAVIEDCAQAHGAQRGGRLAGSIADIGCFSFYPTKNLGAFGDAGALVGNDSALGERLRSLRQYGWRAKYEIAIAHGRNSRMDELQAALLLTRLPQLAADNERRRQIARRYVAEIAHPQLRLPAIGDLDDVVHLFVLRTARRDALRSHLAAEGIGCDIHYPVADHRQPLMAAQHATLSLPHTERAVGEILTLPCHPALSEDEVTRVINACRCLEA
jgi:dTDP-3-amino-2,3,6-trideoxy-4-keto-D-glucose/dTDP-3-amino-3,4,6-trideoxy-alpha-D-glucose/dTDP-2,6-dideoxy-D-kanosamine transaminase